MDCQACGYNEDSSIYRIRTRDKFYRCYVRVIARDKHSDESPDSIHELGDIYICPCCGTMKVDLENKVT